MATTSGTDRRRFIAGGLAGGAVTAASSARAAPQSPAKAPPAPWTSEGFVERPGGRIHWVSMGEGPPLVLLHKLGGWVNEWRHVAPLLAAKHRVIAFDMPGHGDSTMVGPAPFIMTLGEHAAMIHAALQDMGIEKYYIAGASLGGCCAALMAANYPEAVLRLSMISSVLYTASTRDEIRQADEGVKANYAPGWIPLPRTEAQVKEFANIDPSINEENNRSRAKGGAWVRASERGVGVVGMDQVIKRITCPTLLMYADRGRYTVYESLARASIRNTTVAIIKNAGSFVYQEQPAASAAALNAFFV